MTVPRHDAVMTANCHTPVRGGSDSNRCGGRNRGGRAPAKNRPDAPPNRVAEVPACRM